MVVSPMCSSEATDVIRSLLVTEATRIFHQDGPETKVCTLAAGRIDSDFRRDARDNEAANTTIAQCDFQERPLKGRHRGSCPRPPHSRRRSHFGRNLNAGLSLRNMGLIWSGNPRVAKPSRFCTEGSHQLFGKRHMSREECAQPAALHAVTNRLTFCVISCPFFKSFATPTCMDKRISAVFCGVMISSSDWGM